MPLNKTRMNMSLPYPKKLLIAAAITASLTGCGGSSKDEEELAIPQPNQAPVADAGVDQTVDEQTSVTLTGLGNDSDGSITSYSWAQTSGTEVELGDVASASISFTTPDISVEEVLEFTLTVTDNDGATHTDAVLINVSPVFAVLSDLPILYSDAPSLNQQITISLVSDDLDVGTVSWEVLSQPSLANLTLSESQDGKSVILTASEVGDYKVVARSANNASQKSTSFSIYNEFTFDETKIEGNDGNVNLDELIGIIKNQAWVYSSSLTEVQLTELVDGYSNLTILGYDSTDGLLIEFDETDISTNESIELLKLEIGISSIENRLYEGKNVPRSDLLIPKDGSQFDDGGDNWHLEKIDAPLAWEYTTGSNDIIVGVSDSGFDLNHTELNGKITEVLTSKSDDHGNGVAGAIGANTDNEEGMSGINWASKMVLSRSGKTNLKSLLAKDKVVTINNSWSIPGYLDTNFDPNSSVKVAKRNKDTLARTRTYRKLANANLDKLLVWSAGNGIGNGSGNSEGVYGVNGRHHSPALHYSSNGSLQKQENAIFVAAMRDDNRLAYYSNYGVSVDLAAPTSYKSLKTNGGFYTGADYGDGSSGFIGTSASAPVVTGISSLIYSLYPGFTGEEVKDILIESSTESVLERYIAPGDAGENNSNIELLATPIPIVNAEKALQKAQEIIDSKVTVTDSIPNPFVAQARVMFNSIDEDLDISRVEWELQSTDDNGETWDVVNSMSVDGSVIEPLLDTTTPHHRVVATITLKDSGNNETTTTKEYEFNYSTVGVSAVDTVSLAPLASVEVGIELLSGALNTFTGATNEDGIVNAYLKSGVYRVRGNLSEYQEAVALFSTNAKQSQQVALNMTQDSVGLVGSLSGQVLDNDGNPIAKTSIRISGGEQTNGFFATANTDDLGKFVISNISKTDSDGMPIPSFKLEASAFGYATVVKNDVIVLAGKDRVENFTLISVDLSQGTIYADDFELGLGDWTPSGFWNQIDLNNTSIANTLVDNGYTSLAPDEVGPQALLPNAFNGENAWWYGQSDTGSFIGTQASSDVLLSGGRSETSNAGQLTSPSINLGTASLPYLRFRTWWEIESVNPNENGFDVMEVQISTDGASFTTIKKLNPFVDPNDFDRNSKPFSSGGYNRRPVWALEEVDLSAYVGEVITVRFNFQTNDSLYNGFRGWIIDTLEVIDFYQTDTIQEAVSISSSRGAIFSGDDLNNSQKNFINTHKKPLSYSKSAVPSREK